MRQKPKPVRDNIALGIAGVFTALVFSVWLYQVPSQIHAVSTPTKDDDSSAFTELFSSMKDQLATVKESTTTSTSTEVAATTTLVWSDYANATGTIEYAPAAEGVVVATTTVATTTSSDTFSTTSDQLPAPRPIRIVTVSGASTTATTTDGQ